MQKIYHKKSELFEVEFYKNKECTIHFDFTDVKNLYIELVDGDITPLHFLRFKDIEKISIPYVNDILLKSISTLFEFKRNFDLYTLCQTNSSSYKFSTTTPDLSKYIPEDNAVLFLSEEDKNKYSTALKSGITIRECIDGIKWDLIAKDKITKITLFLPHGTQTELQKANEVAKELKEKYEVEKVNLFVLHWFYDDGIKLYQLAIHCNQLEKAITQNEVKEPTEMYSFNKIITTNSTGILELQDIDERLQVIDCYDIFSEYLTTTTN